MHISAKVYSTLITCALLAALFLFSGCDETPTGPEESGPEEMSETGAFTVTTTSDLHLRGLEYCVGDKCKAPDEAGAVRFGELPGGAHEVELTGLSDRCVVEDGNPRAERVTAGDTTAVNFDLKCGDAAMLFVADGPLYEGGPEGGENVLYRAALGASDRTPMVTRASEITRVSSDDRATNAVHISASADGTICWSRSTSPDGDGPSSIFCHLLEGNSTYPITDRGADPAVSADEEWVAFERDGDLFLQSTDGTGEARRLTDTTRVSASDPDFSPDGTEILFAQKA
ncbi:MAG: hypothetical protein GVY35_13160, partial [Bacteroidetes bacterium]|nr:hypothetical protein [Bacteroidota bacterium]